MTIRFDFSGRTAFVTGAGQGIGQAIARTLHGAGATVVVADRNEEGLRAAWPDAERVRHAVLDVADPDACTAAIEAAVHVDILVNNAGITRDAVVWKLADEDWDAVLGVHLTGTFNLTRAAIPSMRARGFGRIINVTSFTGLHGNVGQANYAAAKAGIVGFSKTVAKEVARFGITVNVISPNANTAMVAAVPPDKLAELAAAIPMQRFAEPDEIAPAVAFLASEEASYVTGAVVPVDGGMSM